jgi:hypothetical protein
MRLDKIFAAAGVAAALAAAVASPAGAGTITFETAPSGPSFTGPVTEAGFTYSTASGGLFVNSYGNPSGQDMEGQGSSGGGVLDIVKAGGGTFTFGNLDYAAYDISGVGGQTLFVTGYLGGSTVATDMFTLANTSNYNPTFANWTNFAAVNLAGQSIDDLKISLFAAGAGGTTLQTVDNITLNGVGGVPEPSAWALMLAGFAGLGGALRARRRAGLIAA